MPAGSSKVLFLVQSLPHTGTQYVPNLMMPAAMTNILVLVSHFVIEFDYGSDE